MSNDNMKLRNEINELKQNNKKHDQTNKMLEQQIVYNIIINLD